jgi:glycosyltransferase involved in cell wall biosynthesis
MPQPLKLVLLIRSLNYGGAERQLATLARHLNPQEFDWQVITFYDGGPVADELRAAGIPVVSLAKRGRWDVAGFARRLYGEIRRLRPDIVYSFLDAPNLCALALRPFTGGRLVWGMRASELEIARQDWLVRGAFRLACRLAPRADLIICNSHAGRDFHLARGYPPGKTIVVSNGVDTARFVIDRERGRHLRAAWGVGDGDKLAGLVGRLDPIKDHRNFLQAAAVVHEKRPDARFVCVGDGPADYLRELQAEVAGRVIWAGATDDVTAVYNALDALVLSSTGEGFPNVVAEAMACGVNCVVTDVGDAARIVGDLGRVVPPRQPAALASAISESWDAPAAPETLRARIADNFSAEKLARETARTLLQLV